MSDKPKKQRVEEQRIISNFFELLQFGLYARDGEIGDGKNVLKFVKHDGYTYSVALGNGKRLKLKVEVE